MNNKECITIIHKKPFIQKDKNLFLVSTAMHLFNAIEAQNYFKTSNNILVLLFYGSGNQDEHNVRKYLHLFPYDQLIIFKPPQKRLYHKLNLNLIEIINQHHYNYVFVGYFSANLRRFICNFDYEQLFLYDDGTYTIALHNELYCSTSKPILIKPYSERRRKKKLMQGIFLLYDFYRRSFFKFHGYKNDFESNITLNFFTIFQLSSCQKEQIINHSLNTVKKFFINTETQANDFSQSVFFLGQPLNKVLNIEIDDYLHYLNQIQNFYEQKNLQILYITHRSEDKQTIREIKKYKNFKILTLDIPIEIYILENNIQIQHVASFFSSGLFTLKTLYPHFKAEAFKINFNNQTRHDLDMIYNCAQKSDINIIDLDAKK